MPAIIKNNSISESAFAPVTAEAADIKASNVLLPLKVWLEHRDELKGRNDIGIWLDADEEVEEIADVADEIPVIGLNFPSFFDGRSLSSANILRRKYGFSGELRAIGDVRRDQLEQMFRCGFDAFQLADGQDHEAALAGLKQFSHSYQAAIDRKEPLFLQR
jgi:uncharacterized protein (DUF934 family)